jgi:proteic killer suppression protein
MRNTLNTAPVIKSFLQGLKQLYETGTTSGIQPKHSNRLRMQLAALDTAQDIDDMDIPGFKLHPLKGKMKGRWSISVSGNWRVTFKFHDGNAFVLDYEDYH